MLPKSSSDSLFSKLDDFFVKENVVYKDVSNCLQIFLKISSKPNSASQPNYDRTVLLFPPPMREKDTSALRGMFQYSSLVNKPLDQCNER